MTRGVAQVHSGDVPEINRHVYLKPDIRNYYQDNPYPNLIQSELASRACTVHLASLQALFFNSLAKTAPRWVSNFWRHSTPPDNYTSRDLNF